MKGVVGDEHVAVAAAVPKLVSKQNAAGYLGVSVRTFERHVMPMLARVEMGGRFMYEYEELDRWVER